MHAADDAPDGVVYDAADRLRHELKTPLTTIYARAHLLGRTVRRSSALSEEERATMLGGLAAIEDAVRTMSAEIDKIGRPSPDGHAVPPEGER
jgi:signal transduction histidine kinase